MEKYDVLSVVGEGSYGLVMRCRHRESGQYVAIKKFLETEDDPTVRKMAMREIRMLKKLRHENLVNMIEVFRRKKRFFLVFEYLEHTVLEELEARSGGLGFVTSRKYIFQVLRALDFIHSNDVIHRDIKPENVLVSRQGVIKLCDFGFARPYAENETFTDYVATRWYRSPELLVGDPRYGKEVDIWAVGCLYAEMMTGEPLFPGDSDIDQLFQIVRVLGKLNSRHQILVTRNTMFKGMKQEQNSSLSQLFPEWNRDSLDFLSSCLKMDGNERPETFVLLKHELFTRDDFLDNFLPELRTKITQEIQKNPLLTRVQTGYGSGKPKSSENQNPTIKPAPIQPQTSLTQSTTFENLTTFSKTAASNTNNGNTSQQQFGQILNKPSESHSQKSGIPVSKDRITQIGLSLFPSKTLDSHLFKTSLSGNEDFNLNLTSYKHYLNPNKSKTININNLTFKDLTIVNSNNNNNKYTRVLSAKPKTQQSSNANDSGNNHLQPHSPVQFQSLQPDHHQNTEEKPHSTHKTSPVSSIGHQQGNLSQYFSNKRNSNYLGIQKASHHGTNVTTNKHSPTRLNFNPNTIPSSRQNLIKRGDRGLLLDVGISPFAYGDSGGVNLLPSSTNNNIGNGSHQKIEASPRVLQPPQWLQSGNLKITSHGKTTQIGKRGLTDWKTISNSNGNMGGGGGVSGGGAGSMGLNDAANSGNNNLSNNQKDDFVLPNCPGASLSTTTSPYKGLKKKLSPMPTLSHDSQLQNHHVSPRNIHPISPEIPANES